MRKARVFVNRNLAGVLEEVPGDGYQFQYYPDYKGAPVSLTMPISDVPYQFQQFPPFFEGLLPEGIQLEALLRRYKLDKNDYFGQLMQVGNDVVGAVTIEELQ